jgi:hypothetical protein
MIASRSREGGPFFILATLWSRRSESKRARSAYSACSAGFSVGQGELPENGAKPLSRLAARAAFTQAMLEAALSRPGTGMDWPTFWQRSLPGIMILCSLRDLLFNRLCSLNVKPNSPREHYSQTIV